MQKSIQNDNEQEVSMFLDHGIDCNALISNDENEVPLTPGRIAPRVDANN